MAELAAAMAADEKLDPLVSGESPLQKADGTWAIRDVKSPTVAAFCALDGPVPDTNVRYC